MIDAAVFPLNEGFYTIGFDKVFYPFDPNKDVLEERSKGSLLVEIQPFLIVTDSRKILLDTGLGFVNPETNNLRIEDNLRKHNLSCTDITDVVMSHLHKDHAGGFFRESNGVLESNFPNATFHINRKEYEFAIDPNNELSYEADKIKSLAEQASIQWFENNRVFDFMTYEEDGGHCPYHTSLLIHTNSGAYFFGGDVAPQLKQLKFRYIAKYDFDGRKSAELRSAYARRGAAQDWTFLFYHDVSTPMSKI